MRRGLPLLALLLASCGQLPRAERAGDPRPALGARAGEWESAAAAADRAFALGRWAESGDWCERAISVLTAGRPEGEPLPERLALATSRARFNLACSRALEGRKGAALDALEAVFAEGFAAIGYEHLVEDPDLLSLHGEPRWEALIERLSWNEEFDWVGYNGMSPLRALVVWIGGKPKALDGAAVAVPIPPYRESPGSFVWTTRIDSGERAARKVRFAARQARLESFARRLVLRAEGAEEVRIAWEVLLRHPEEFPRAVLVGPAPPAWRLLDRGAEKVRTEVLVAGVEGVPAKEVPVKVRNCGSVEAAMAEALR